MVALVLACHGRIAQKYGPADAARVEGALRRFCLPTPGWPARRLVFVDRVETMGECASDVVDPTNATWREFRAATVCLAREWRPAHILLFGADDLFPAAELQNPTYDGDVLESDLPYAVDGLTGDGDDEQVGSYMDPRWPIGRLPDRRCVPDTPSILRVIANARNMGTHPWWRASTPFVLCCQDWRAVTEATACLALGRSPAIATSPPSGPAWPETTLRRPVHLLNLHGDGGGDTFFGRPSDPTGPAALKSRRLGRALPGVVVGAECCYGAQLWQPATDPLSLPFGNAYLEKGAAGFFGSTTQSYGGETLGSTLPHYADVLVASFLSHARAGRSLGEAAHEARRDFVAHIGTMPDATAQKTLAQFRLLGDPAARPLRPFPIRRFPPPARRRRAREGIPQIQRVPKHPIPAPVLAAFAQAAERHPSRTVARWRRRSWSIRFPGGTPPGAPDRVVTGTMRLRGTRKHAGRIVGLSVWTRRGRILEVRAFESR